MATTTVAANPMRIQVRIGDVEVNYLIKVTRAPREYDGFGTFTVVSDFDHDGARLCCVREEHAGWQLGRNQSGRYSLDDPPAGMRESDVRDALFARLWRGDERTNGR
jgi:hypothetical protein